MPKGMKETSSLIVISQSVTESGANTFTSERVDLQLNPLDRECFVIYSVNLDATVPDSVDAVDTTVLGSLSSTQRTTVGGIDQTNVIASLRMDIQNQTTNAVFSEFKSDSTPTGMLPYLSIVATNDFFLNIQGINNGAAKAMNARVYGARVKVDADIYSALVQSELLSA